MVSRRDAVKTLAGGTLGLAAAPFLRFPAAAAAGPSVTLAYPADVSTWDPIAGGSLLSVGIHRCVFDKPFNLAPDLSFGPGVITGHRFEDGGRVLELDFRSGVTFQNGDPLTSDDFKFTYWDRTKADPSLTLSASFASIDGIETPSPAKAIVHFKTPFVTAPQLLADVSSYILPRRYFEKVGLASFIEKPIGSGPYRLVDYQRDSRIVLEAYDGHWAGPARIKNVTFQIIKDASARIAAIQSGQVDFAHNLPVREVVRLGALPGLTANLHSTTAVILIHMVNKGIFRDQNLRLAMHHAIDKQALSNAFFAGKASPLSMWSGEGMPANDPEFKFAFDPGKAKALLAASGYGLEKPARIEFTTMNGVFPSDFDMARAIVQMWKQVGIEANLSVMEVAQFYERLRTNQLEAPVLQSWYNGSGDPLIYTGFILDPKKPFSVWKSDDITPRLDPLLTEVNYEKRMAGYRALDKWVVEQGYAVPLLQGLATVVHAKRIGYVPFKSNWVLPYYWSIDG